VSAGGRAPAGTAALARPRRGGGGKEADVCEAEDAGGAAACESGSSGKKGRATESSMVEMARRADVRHAAAEANEGGSDIGGARSQARRSARPRGDSGGSKGVAQRRQVQAGSGSAGCGGVATRSTEGGAASLIKAAADGSLRRFRQYLDRDPDMDLFVVDKEGDTALHSVLVEGSKSADSITIVETLLKLNPKLANYPTQDNNGHRHSPLICLMTGAAHRGEKFVGELPGDVSVAIRIGLLLLHHGADPMYDFMFM
jgi:hypothetical protein